MPVQNFTLNLDDGTYQAALNRAQREGKTLEGLMAEFLLTYTQGMVSGLSTPSTTYTVQPGDSLSKIARQVYGEARYYPLIQQANNIDSAGQIQVGQVLVIPPLAGAGPTPVSPMPQPTAPSMPQPTAPPTPQPAQPQPQPAPPTPQPAPQPQPRFDPCEPIPGVSYKLLTINGSPTDRPAPVHGDLNLALRSYVSTNATAGLISMGGATDESAPQLRGLFADRRTPNFPRVYRVHDWDWGKGPQGGQGAPLTKYEVTLIGMTVKPGEILYVPNANYSIGEGMQVLVLYATPERITLKYTREDNVVDGYTLHLEGICVEPTLQQVYNQMDAAGRRQLLALAAGKPFGRARDTEIKVAIRDKGTFMDPRTGKDWWRG